MAKKVSQKDIARELNIARVTVTKALQGHPDISAATVARVRKKARQMGYIPSFIGRTLSTNKTHMIGVVLPRFDNSFYAQSLHHFCSYAGARGYDVLPLISFEDSAKERQKIEMLLSMHMDGIILIPSYGDVYHDIFDRIRSMQIPAVFYERVPEYFEGYSATCDEKTAAKKAILYALDNGYRHIVHLAGPHWLNTGNQKLRGYLEALNAYRIAPAEEYICHVGPDMGDGYRAVMDLIRKGLKIDLVFCWNDLVAHGVYRAAKELELSVPGDMAVIGFGDLERSRLLAPPLSTVSLPVKAMANTAMEMLFDLIAGKRIASHTFDAIFKIRKSTTQKKPNAFA
jgi:DNA-binding LacI/PurR family transcriptional regulator